MQPLSVLLRRTKVAECTSIVKLQIAYRYSTTIQEEQLKSPKRVIHRNKLNTLGKKLGIKTLDDWYKISANTVLQHTTLLKEYKSSLFNALKELYPEHQWDASRFSSVPKHFWSNEDNQRSYLERIGKRFGVQQLDDWYKISRTEVQLEAPFIASHYKGSLFSALKKLYPNHPWSAEKFSTALSGHFTLEVNQRKRMDALGAEFGVVHLDDWYHVPLDAVRKRASFIHDYYKHSVILALQKLYPEHKWDILRFNRIPRGFWQLESTRQHYQQVITQWQREYNINELMEWYQLLPQDKVEVFQKVARGLFGGVTKMLREWFPHKNWCYRVQGSIPELDLQVLHFPSIHIFKVNPQWMLKLVANTKVHQKVGNYSVDVFVPEWRIAFEFQGEQHYLQGWRGDFLSQHKYDNEKQKYFKEQGISLVHVNHQWNGNWAQLKATLKQHRPDLFQLPPSSTKETND